MKKRFINKLIACTLAFVTAFGVASTSVGAAIIQIDKELYNSIPQKFTTIDLRPFANRGFVDDVEGDGVGGWGDGGPDNDLRNFTLYGTQYFCGVEFDIINPATNKDKSCIILRGQNDERVPLSVEIDVNQKAGGAYFIHAASWASDSNGKYIFEYADGTEYAHELVLKQDVADWWGVTESTNLRTAWEGECTRAGLISLGLFALENPYPEKEIAKLKLVSNGDGSYIHIVGVTLTDKTPVLPKIVVDDTNNPDTSEWWEYQYPRNYENKSGTALDGSFLLDAPAGKHGFATCVGEHFVFEDGTVERMYGLNAGSTSNYASYEASEYQAMILAQNGVNVVRCHALDGAYDAKDINGNKATMSDTSELDWQALDRFHYFVYQLKKRGIYVWLDLHAGKPIYADDDIRLPVLDSYNDMYFYEPMKERIKDRVEQMMLTVNPYTGVPLAEEPSIITVSYSNEKNVFISNFTNPYYREYAQKLYNEWLCEKYPTREDLHNAWIGDGVGLADGEDQFKGTVKIQGQKERKLGTQRAYDNVAFLGYITDDFIKDMMEHYRSIGGKQPVTAGTILIEQASEYAKANESADVMDTHAYYHHPGGDTSGWNNGQTGGKPQSWTNDPTSGLLSTFTAIRLKGYPLTVTEWNTGQINQYNAELHLIFGAHTGMQNMYPMWFSQQPFVGEGELMNPTYRFYNKEFSMNAAFPGLDTPDSGDQFLAGAVAHRAVTESEYAYYEPRNGENFYKPGGNGWKYKNSAYLIGKVGIADRDVDNTQSGYENLILAATRDAEENNKPFVSLTDELYMDRQNGIYKHNTGKSQAAAGFMQGEVIELDDIIMEPDTRYCAIALSSLSKDKDIYEQDRLLLTATARSRTTGLVLSNTGTQIIDRGTTPLLMEPVKGKFTLKTDADVKVYALSTEGARIKEVPVVKGNGVSTFELTGKERADSFEIVKTGGSNKKNEKVSFNPYQDTPLFKDVAEEDREEIERVFLTNTMRATGADTFTPDGTISRGDFTVAFMNASDKLGYDAVEPFTDVTEDMSCYKGVMNAAKAGIVFGKGDGTFGPDEDITVDEVNAMLERIGVEKRISGDKVTRKLAAQALYAIIVS